MGSNWSSEPPPKPESKVEVNEPLEDDDEPDEWDKRIYSTGCAVENTKMNDCYYEKKDWRLCKEELEKFKECWKRQKNDERTEMKDA